MRRPRHITTLLVSALAALAVTGCSSDPEPDVGEPAVEATTDAGAGDADTGAAAGDAQEVLEQAGVDINANGTAEVQFMGETYAMDAAAQLGCFIAPDAGSDGTVNFDGGDEAGNELYVEWSGDSAQFGRVEFTTPDGDRYSTVYDTALDVSVDGSSAEVTSMMTLEVNADGEEELTASLSCGG